MSILLLTHLQNGLDPLEYCFFTSRANNHGEAMPLFQQIRKKVSAY